MLLIIEILEKYKDVCCNSVFLFVFFFSRSCVIWLWLWIQLVFPLIVQTSILYTKIDKFLQLNSFEMHFIHVWLFGLHVYYISYALCIKDNYIRFYIIYRGKNIHYFCLIHKKMLISLIYLFWVANVVTLCFLRENKQLKPWKIKTFVVFPCFVSCM